MGRLRERGILVISRNALVMYNGIKEKGIFKRHAKRKHIGGNRKAKKKGIERRSISNRRLIKEDPSFSFFFFLVFWIGGFGLGPCLQRLWTRKMSFLN
jgi:hypothetical protein